MTNTLFQEENIYSTIQSYSYVLRIFGFMSFSFVHDKNPASGVNTKITCLDVLSIIKTFLLCIIYIAFISPVYSLMREYDKTCDTKIQNIGGTIMYISEIFIINIVMVNNFIGRQKILNFIKLLYEFDQHVCMGYQETNSVKLIDYPYAFRLNILDSPLIIESTNCPSGFI